ncbi:tetratricopeptide repeat protein [Thiobacter aerophilum]|uniref:Tetratricopeptide repeat protein n=1 Tax=Thiobacter aerophilum TaxID=3121275 RepID=A0ABV0EE68_9BURK
MNTFSFLRAAAYCALAATLTGCAGLAARPTPTVSPVPATPTSLAQAVIQSEALAAPKRPTPPTQALTQQLLYETLLAEIALQRGDARLATQAYLDLLARTRDYRIAERATQVALQSRLIDQALTAAKRWLELEPESVAARQTVAAILVTQGRLDEARPHLTKLLAAEGANLGHGFLHLNNLLARHGNKEEVLSLVQTLAQPYPQLPEAHFAVARAAWNAGKTELALAAIREALRLRPDWEDAALFQAQMLAARAPDKASAYFTDYLARYPRAREMRLAYARFLVQQKQYSLARAEFQTLVKDFPDNAEVPLAVGLISLQMGELDVARQYLEQALQAGVRDRDTVYLYLGQIAEEEKRYEEARRWYVQVSGEQGFTARLRQALTLAKEGRLDEARTQLAQIQPANNQQRVQLWQAEAQMLREAKRDREAFELLTRALEKLPNHPDLLYDQAMAAERLNRLDVLEASLRKLIQLKPDHAHAYNALGYTFADRGIRLEEARQLLETALKLAPDDPFILDSMGWLAYRLKDYPKSIEYLRRAAALRPDPEIAAHLGEVLWMSGARTEAQHVWGEALKSHPGNDALLEAMRRCQAMPAP